MARFQLSLCLGKGKPLPRGSNSSPFRNLRPLPTVGCRLHKNLLTLPLGLFFPELCYTQAVILKCAFNHGRSGVDFKFLVLSKITSFACQLLIFQEKTAAGSKNHANSPSLNGCKLKMILCCFMFKSKLMQKEHFLNIQPMPEFLLFHWPFPPLGCSIHLYLTNFSSLREKSAS